MLVDSISVDLERRSLRQAALMGVFTYENANTDYCISICEVAGYVILRGVEEGKSERPDEDSHVQVCDPCCKVWDYLGRIQRWFDTHFFHSQTRPFLRL